MGCSFLVIGKGYEFSVSGSYVGGILLLVWVVQR